MLSRFGTCGRIFVLRGNVGSAISVPVSCLRSLNKNTDSPTVNTVRHKSDDKITRDPFGVSYNDGEEKLGPESELPPKYVRDPISGKLTGETESEPSQGDAELLNMSGKEKQVLLRERLTQSWNADGDGMDEDDIARLIRREKMALNTLGRKSSDLPKSKASITVDDDDDDDIGELSAPLSPSEFASFQKYAKQYQDQTVVGKEDIPIMTPTAPGTERGFDPDQDLSWVKASQGEVSEDAWMDDILPSDLAPARKLNRNEAQPIPKELLHHNNLSLLRRYVTPGGQILNRVQSRLGAKDQRKVAKLIKRARHLGLIPNVGQWKYEDHGDLFAPDIHEDRDWEKELKQRGLVIEQENED